MKTAKGRNLLCFAIPLWLYVLPHLTSINGISILKQNCKMPSNLKVKIIAQKKRKNGAAYQRLSKIPKTTGHCIV